MNLEPLLIWAFDLLGPLLQVSDEVREQRNALLQDDYVKYSALNGMKLRIYDVVTTDGWVLQLWRVQSPKIYDRKLSAPVILCGGFASLALSFMLHTRNESLAFILADNGYDVWIVNWRGNVFSNRKMSEGQPAEPKDSDYYRTGWQHMAEFDIPATMDFVLSETKHPSVYLMGHSMGATVVHAFLAENHSYDDKISHYISITPVLRYKEDASTILKVVFGFSTFATKLSQSYSETLFGAQSRAPTRFVSLARSVVCTVVPELCLVVDTLGSDRALSMTFTRNQDRERPRVGIYQARGAGGSTNMAVYSFAMQYGKDTWRKIDYDKLGLTGLTNQGEYNMDKPPVVDFAALNVTYSLFFVYNDPIVGHGTAKATAEYLGARDVQYIEGDDLSHAGATSAPYSRCYVADNFMEKLNDIEAKRDNARKKYRRKAAAFAKRLPFEDGCIGKRKS